MNRSVLVSGFFAAFAVFVLGASLPAFAATTVPEVISVNFYNPTSSSGAVPNGDNPLPGLSGHEVLEKEWVNVCTRSNEVEYVDNVPVRKPLSLGPTGSKLYWYVPGFACFSCCACAIIFTA